MVALAHLFPSPFLSGNFCTKSLIHLLHVSYAGQRPEAHSKLVFLDQVGVLITRFNLNGKKIKLKYNSLD